MAASTVRTVDNAKLLDCVKSMQPDMESSAIYWSQNDKVKESSSGPKPLFIWSGARAKILTIVSDEGQVRSHADNWNQGCLRYGLTLHRLTSEGWWSGKVEAVMLQQVSDGWLSSYHFI